MINIDNHDTIVGPATPPGEGGVGIIRLSGSLAETYLLRLFHPSEKTAALESHYFYYGRFQFPDGALLDEVMAILMRGPRSYTKEDVVEVHCHGGPVVMRRILDLFINEGARLARPGEFTLRAFLNGRIDLVKAEAVIDVIRSRSHAAHNNALGHLEGRLSAAIDGFRADLADLLSLVEAYIDFPEEDMELPDQERVCSSALDILGRMDTLLATFDEGRALREGAAVLILGRPNVGKSSLMNALLGETRAIVTDISGTTRDTIEESLVVGGLPLRLVDTAGICNTSDRVEFEGVRRAREKVSSADLVLLVVDGSRVPGKDDFLALEACRDVRVLLVVNKSDLPSVSLPLPFSDLPLVRISAQTGEGIKELQQKMVSFFKEWGSDARESVLLSNRRHREALVRSRQALHRFYTGLGEEISLEFLSLDLRECLQALGEITGETTPGEILERIFSRFCIGK
jgi:tRNA modification GTPase